MCNLEPVLALGVNVRLTGHSPQSVGYLGKALDPVAKECPGCLQEDAAACLQITEGPKITLACPLVVYVPMT